MKGHRSTLLLVLLLVAAQFALATGPSGAADSKNPEIVLPLDPATDAGFGRTIALDGNTLVVGAPGADGGAGAVYVFVRTGKAWSQQAKLLSPTGVPRRFGANVALSADTLVVSDHGEYDDGHPEAGAVYVFTHSAGQWSSPARVTPDDPSSYKWFGASLGISEETIVVGAYGDWIGGYEQVGSAYVFVPDGDSWSQQAKLTDAIEAEYDRFGYGVAIDGDTIAVRAISDESLGFGRAGTVVVFSRSGNTWSRDAELIRLMSGETPEPGFGWEVAVSGRWIVVGAPGDTTVFGYPPEAAPNNGGPHEESAGAIYVFRRSKGVWEYDAKVLASDARPGADFGMAVAVSSEAILVGSYSDQVSGVRDAGSAYLYKRHGGEWQQRAKYTAPSPTYRGDFSWSVDLDASTAAIGAPRDESAGPEASGAAYVVREPSYFCGHERATLVGGERNDEFTGTSRSDVIVGLGGDDILRGRGGDDVICGGPGHDQLRGGNGSDQLFGGKDIDTIHPGLGDDAVVGGSGAHDSVSYQGSASGVVVSLRSGTAAGSGNDTLAGVENIIGSQFDDELVGDRRSNYVFARRGADIVRGRSGDDYIWGHGGPDILKGGSGSDTIYGGAGNDTCTGEFMHEC